MLKKLTVNLIVDDVNETIKFYRDTLGCFELVITDPKNGKFNWALMRCEDLELMFQSRESLKKKIKKFDDLKTGGTVILYIEVEGIDALYEWIKDYVKIVAELQDTPYRMKEFLIEDCNGFILAFAEWH